MRKKKILYIYSDTGGGHRAAAEALMQAVKKVKGDEIDQEMIDLFAAGSGFLNFFARLYGPVINNVKFIWRFLWYSLNNEKNLKRLENFASIFILNNMVKIFKKIDPDVIVSVHPLVNHLTVRALKKLGKKTPFLIVGMDPVDLHKSWMCKDADLLFVATDEAKQLCLDNGMPEEKIKLLGFPVKPGFIDVSDKTEIRKKIGLNTDMFTVLIMGGGEGAGNIYETALGLSKADDPMQLIVICGRNQGLKDKLEKIEYKFPKKIYGFTNEVPMIMGASDLIITKGGPGAIFEAVAKDLPMIITNWLPGQEEGNIRFVKERKIGVIEKDPKKMNGIVEQIRKGDEFSQMKNNIIKIKKSRAIFDIVDIIIGYAGK